MKTIKDIITNFKKYWFLMTQIISRDFKVKYKRSVLGVVWSLLYPILMMLVMALVFSKMFRFSVPGVNYFVYFDPPYYPVSETSNFTRYTSRPFTQDDQIDLYNYCLDLDKRGVKFMLSNSNSDFIIDLYSKSSNFNITYIETKRLLNCDASKRGRKVKEIVVRNY